MVRTTVESVVVMNTLLVLMHRIVNVMDTYLVEINEDYNILMTALKKTFHYFTTILTLQTKVLTQPTKRFSQHKMFLVLQERCQ